MNNVSINTYNNNQLPEKKYDLNYNTGIDTNCKQKNYEKKRLYKDYTCTNCGSKKHIYKNCTKPITSFGIILVKYGDLKKPIHDMKVNFNVYDMQNTNVKIECESDMQNASNVINSLQFLLISRKHSLGYVEFIRGRYRPEKIDQIIYLFRQMMQHEINKIRYSLNIKNGFDYLWNDFWGKKASSALLLKDRELSFTNYELMRMNCVNGPELTLEYITENVKAEYNIPEWGFPKGRRNRNESYIACAIREFTEETEIGENEFEIVKEIEPIIEDFIGTNGISYRHIYYVAELKTNNELKIIGDNEEIGSVCFLDYSTANEYIREYHNARKVILNKLMTYYIDKLLLSNK